MNDTDAHLDAIAALAALHPLAGVELTPYHALGRDKRRRFGRPAGPVWPTASPEQADAWIASLATLGCAARLG